MKPVLLIIALLLIAGPARAQLRPDVIINQAALDQLAGVTPTPPVIAAPKPPIRRAVHIVFHPRRLPKPLAAAPAAAVAPLPPPKPAPAIAVPIAAKPALPKLPPPPAVIIFAEGSADLPATAAAALKPLCASTRAIDIDAYAPADISDPSSAPRLSMSRAFAIRDALTACGVPSQSIIPRADGAASGKNPNTAEVTQTP